MSEIKLTKRNFEEEAINSDKPVLIDFWADWCGPCQMLGPVIEQIANEHPEIKVGKVNVDREPQLAASYGVVSIPTVIVMKNGKVVNSSTGYRPKEEILAMVRV